MKTEALKKRAKDTAGQFLCIFGGILAGSVLMNLVKEMSKGKVPAWAIPLFTSVGIAANLLTDNKYVQYLGSAIMATGGVQALHLIPNDQGGNVAKVKGFLPKMVDSGAVIVNNPPPSDAAIKGLGMTDTYARLVNGLGNYSMEQLVL